MIITEAAKKEIAKNGKFLKITAQKGGCAGMFYEIEYTSEAQNLQVIENLILTDEFSFNLIKNIQLDFIKELGYKEFKITNPDAKKNCKCGISFF